MLTYVLLIGFILPIDFDYTNFLNKYVSFDENKSTVVNIKSSDSKLQKIGWVGFDNVETNDGEQIVTISMTIGRNRLIYLFFAL